VFDSYEPRMRVFLAKMQEMLKIMCGSLLRASLDKKNIFAF
jgi:hypothetical protein